MVSVITSPASEPLKVPLPVLCKTLFLNSMNVKVPLNWPAALMVPFNVISAR